MPEIASLQHYVGHGADKYPPSPCSSCNLINSVSLAKSKPDRGPFGSSEGSRGSSGSKGCGSEARHGRELGLGLGTEAQHGRELNMLYGCVRLNMGVMMGESWGLMMGPGPSHNPDSKANPRLDQEREKGHSGWEHVENGVSAGAQMQLAAKARAG